jgi:hypothetical protein
MELASLVSQPSTSSFHPTAYNDNASGTSNDYPMYSGPKRPAEAGICIRSLRHGDAIASLSHRYHTAFGA